MKGFAIFLTGALAGAALTALFTPERGEDMRARIKLLLQKKGIIPSDNIDDFVEMLAAEIEEK